MSALSMSHYLLIRGIPNRQSMATFLGQGENAAK